MDEIDSYYEEFIKIPALTRKRQLYAFETYVNSRNYGFSAEQIYKHFKMEV